MAAKPETITTSGGNPVAHRHNSITMYPKAVSN